MILKSYGLPTMNDRKPSHMFLTLPLHKVPYSLYPYQHFISLPMVCRNICERIYSKIEVTPIWQAKNIAEDVSVT